MILFKGTLFFAFLLLVPLFAFANETVAILKNELNTRLLLQISYEKNHGLQDFRTSRSRIVILQRHDGVLRIIEEPHDSISPSHLLIAIPMRGETARALIVDFNAGLVSNEEDRTGEDYYGRVNRQDFSLLRLSQPETVSVFRDGPILVIKQRALDEFNEPVLVHYYFSPYRPNQNFTAFEINDLKYFGFYETYPQRQSGRTVLYAMKFGIYKPIVFALSSEIPARYRQAVRDGVLYWNKALGRPLLHVVDAPEGVTVPNPEYNVIQWVTDQDYASTSHIQGDPLTGEILHAYIFILSETIGEDEANEQSNHLRHIVAHEVGHALGLRHNFAKGPVSTVMNYPDLKQALRIGRDVIQSGNRALEYDRKVMRHVYLGEPLNIEVLPAFCTDSQPECNPSG